MILGKNEHHVLTHLHQCRSRTVPKDIKDESGVKEQKGDMI